VTLTATAGARVEEEEGACPVPTANSVGTGRMSAFRLRQQRRLGGHLEERYGDGWH